MFIAKIKESFTRYLNKLAEVNKEQFGGKTLDCCKLNKPPVKQNKKE